MLDKQLSQEEIDKLFAENKAQFGIMNMAAGNMIKGLLYELQRKNRNTYIRLHNAAKDGHTVYYKMVQGDPEIVLKAAKALKFKTYTNDFLEVNS